MRDGFAGRDVAGVLAATEGSKDAVLDTVAAIDLANGRGLMLFLTKKRGPAHELLMRVGEAAQGIGWLDRAASAFSRAGTSAYQAGNFLQAGAAWERRLAIERMLADPVAVAKALNNLGIVAEATGDLPRAYELYAESLDLERKRGNEPGIARTLTNIGLVHEGRDEFGAALGCYEEALRIERKIGRKIGVARLLNNTGNVHHSLGNLSAALRYYDECATVARANRLTDLIGGTLGNIGLIRRELGDYPGAIRCFEDALALERQRRNAEGVAMGLLNLGNTASFMGDSDGALRYLREALDISRQTGDRIGEVAALRSISTVQGSAGEPENALATAREALVLQKTLHRPSTEASILGSIGSLQNALGKYKQAVKTQQAALKIQRRYPRPEQLARILVSLGDAWASTGDLAKAGLAFEEALAITAGGAQPEVRSAALSASARLALVRDHPTEAVLLAREGAGLVGELARGLAEGEGAGVREEHSGSYAIGTLASLRSDQIDDLLWFLEVGRANSLRDSLGSRSALEAAVLDPELCKLLNGARHRERKTVRELQRASQNGDLKLARVAREAWRRARTEVEQANARVERKHKRAAAVTRSRPDSLKEIQARLGKTEALVLYGLTSQEAVALVIRPKDRYMVALAPSKEVEAATAALLDHERHIDPSQVAELRKLLVEPLDLDPKVSRVLVSPTGRLGYVPFSLLLPERVEVTFVPSGTTYGLLATIETGTGTGILGIGDPDYGAAAGTAGGGPRHGQFGKLQALPGTRKEVEAVATRKVLGKQATESALALEIGRKKRWRSVHLACHGFADPERPLQSALALTPDAENDGFLTALEIFRMRIPADLVVLSACQTGKGRIYKTDGILGLTRAFMYAWAPRVICSLLDVDDDATRFLML